MCAVMRLEVPRGRPLQAPGLELSRSRRAWRHGGEDYRYMDGDSWSSSKLKILCKDTLLVVMDRCMISPDNNSDFIYVLRKHFCSSASLPRFQSLRKHFCSSAFLPRFQSLHQLVLTKLKMEPGFY